MMGEIRIREATVEDAPELARIQVVGWQSAYRGQMPQDFLDGLSVERRREQQVGWLTNPAPKSHTLVPIMGDQIVGFSIVGSSLDKDSNEKNGHLYAIYLDPPSIGKGIGAMLLGESAAVLRREGFTSATLWVLATNASARGFYEHHGWVLQEGVTNTEWIGDFQLLELRYRHELNTSQK